MAGAVDDIVVNTGENQVVKYAMIGGMILVFGAIAYYGIVSPILESLGIKEDDTDKEANNRYERAKNSGYWGTSYYTKFSPSSVGLNPTNAGQIAENIYNSFNVVNDNEQQVFANFNSIQNNAQLSYVSWQFNKKYSSDLLEFLKGKLSSAELLVIFDKTESLK